jgi:hypothetical protein
LFVQAEATFLVLPPSITPANLATSTSWLEGTDPLLRLLFQDAAGKGVSINLARISVMADMSSPPAGVIASRFELALGTNAVRAAAH